MECMQRVPFIAGDGLFIGRMQLFKTSRLRCLNIYEDFHVDIQELFGSGDKVVMVGYYEGVWKATGKEFKANVTHVWTVKEGKLTHFFQAVDTATIINP